MLNTKKTLILKTSYDISACHDAAIPHVKDALKATAIASGFEEDQIDFEIIETKKSENSAQTLLSAFYKALYGIKDDDDEVVHDEE